MQQYLLNLVQALLTQLIGIFGIFFLFGFVLSKVQKATNNNYRRSVGWKGILWTAWIGTPVHELGHYFFAKLFRHKVDSVRIFSPNEETGGLGHVDHSYKKTSLYQAIGNFFIGAAPMIFGSLILVTMLYFLVPNGKEVFEPLKDGQAGIIAILVALEKTLINLFTLENLRSWNFWLFLYVSFCIASHIAPSKKDQRGMWAGFIWIVLLLLILNAATLAIKLDITELILNINQYLGIFIAIFTYALIISLIHFLLSNLILFPFKKRF